MAKSELAHYEQFILLQQCFQIASFAEAPESVFMWENANISMLHNKSVNIVLMYHRQDYYLLLLLITLFPKGFTDNNIDRLTLITNIWLIRLLIRLNGSSLTFV